MMKARGLFLLVLTLASTVLCSIPAVVTPPPTPLATIVAEASAHPTDEATVEATPSPTEADTPSPTRLPSSTPTATDTGTPTEEPTASREPSPTRLPTLASTITPTASPTRDSIAIPDSAPNLLKNPGMDGTATQYNARIFDGQQMAVAPLWEPFYCDHPHVNKGCDAFRQGDGNEKWLQMGRPEYKPSFLPERCIQLNEWGTRITSQPCQQWFLFYRAGFAGVKQTIQVPPGSWCEAGAYVHSWSMSDGILDTERWDLSFLANEDARKNSTWYVLINTEGTGRLIEGTGAGDTLILSPGTITSRGFGYDDGIYDPPNVKISYQFTAPGSKITVGFGDLRLWPFRQNDSYLNGAYVKCTS